MIRTVTIDCSAITDWESFHKAFASAFCFPGYYGKNPNAWVECMAELDDENLSDFGLLPGEFVLLDLSNAAALKRTAPEILSGVLELTGIVNFHRVKSGEAPFLLVACFP